MALTTDQKLDKLTDLVLQQHQENTEFRRTSMQNQQVLTEKFEGLSNEITEYIKEHRQEMTQFRQEMTNVILSNRSTVARLDRSIAEMQLWRQEIHDAVIRIETTCGRIELKNN
jgi:phage-related minor tail protein